MVGVFALTVAGCVVVTEPDQQAVDEALFDLSATELAAQLASGERTSVAVVSGYLARIEAIDRTGPTLRAVIELNPDALVIAEALDRQLAADGPVGPLHGVPVLLKANIDTGDSMATSAGSIALADHRAADDAAVVERLRADGAVILGKTNLSEWAYFRSDRMESGWSSLGGQTRNPHVLDRNPCGSSSGSAVAVAAALAPLAVGTETDGSIVCPASHSGIVGIKPSLGLVSRDGIIPIAHSQDTAGPMATDVDSAALLLESLLSLDPEGAVSVTLPAGVSLRPDTSRRRLDGVRIGVMRGRTGWLGEQTYLASIEALQGLGATLVDPIDATTLPDVGEDEFLVLQVEFKDGLNRYLAASEVGEDRDTLAELIAFNEANAETVLAIGGQEIFEMAEATQGLKDPEYLAALERSIGGMRAWLDDQFASHELDAIVLPSNSPAWKTDWLFGSPGGLMFTSTPAAVSGYPSITVPAGFERHLPLGLSFLGPMLSDAELIQIAYVFEQATLAHRAPAFLPSVELTQPSKPAVQAERR